uniref:Gastrokine 1 n=1 Tax=Leptobrachium leishanense TaxID=445787 RepID=A0A8C5M9C4_9ANUR
MTGEVKILGQNSQTKKILPFISLSKSTIWSRLFSSPANFPEFHLSLSRPNVDVGNEGNVGGNVHQVVNINNQDNVASVNSLNGWNSWDSICDYGRGFIATRPYAKKICIVSKMNKDVFPSLAELSSKVNQKQKAPSPQITTYSINQKPIVHIEEFGQHIESLCKGLPAYTALEIPSKKKNRELIELLSFCIVVL